MARNRAMAGPGSKKMGGAGIKPGRPMTPMAGSGLGAPKGGPAAAMGAPPMAPKVANVRPPGMGPGMAPPMPGGSGGPPPPPPGQGGMGGVSGGIGGGAGFAKGGPTPPPGTGIGLPPSPTDPLSTPAYKKGGSVGIRMGGDTKPRYKGKSHK